VAFVKEKFGIDITPMMFSAYKSNFAKLKVKGRRGRPKGSAGRPKGGRSNGNGIAAGGGVIGLISEVRKLSDRYGAELVGKWRRRSRSRPSVNHFGAAV